MNKKRTVLLVTMFMSLMCMYYTFTKTTDQLMVHYYCLE